MLAYPLSPPAVLYKQPLRPEQRDLSKLSDPGQPYYYYKSLFFETIQKILNIYGILENSDALPFLIISVIVLALDTLGSFPLLVFGLHTVRTTGKRPPALVTYVFEGMEYMTDALYAVAALVLRNIRGSTSLYDQLQLCVTSVTLALKLWKFTTNLLYSWTDNHCIVCSNKVFFAMCMYMIILISCLTAFQVMAEDVFIQIFMFCAIVIMYFVYATIWILFQRTCCRTCCFQNNQGKCCCPKSQLLVNHPQLATSSSSQVELDKLPR
eukprot:TRINITY_DN5702_c0_g1_i9.p1 TRINITY_DN5702_c0_g1~~TRINITY_DN5702_c0_g1_i9.p1  ORF type:complete len:267 (-),score=-4.60 TRINITY_DN5702_c0_g1_i9:40-840(-)